ADVNADTEFDSLVLRNRGILLSHTTLGLDGASRCIDRARELDQHTVAGGLYDAPSMRGDGWIDKGFSDRLELCQRAFFVRTHQAAVAGNIRRKNSRQSPFHALVAQNAPRPGKSNAYLAEK